MEEVEKRGFARIASSDNKNAVSVVSRILQGDTSYGDILEGRWILSTADLPWAINGTNGTACVTRPATMCHTFSSGILIDIWARRYWRYARD